MRRREFIAALGGAAAWPLMARAQQPAMPVIGFLHSASPSTSAEQLAGFRQGLMDGGYAEGRNVTIEYLWAEGQFERLPALAADLVRRQVSVIAAMGGSNLAAKTATKSVPIVFTTGADPIERGLVTSLNRPGGNITGISFFGEELGSKGLGLLHELVPKISTIGLLVNPDNRETARQSTHILEAALVLGLKIQITGAATPGEIDKAFEFLIPRGVGALLTSGDPFLGSRVDQLVGLAKRHKLPTLFPRREYAEAGGLATYGTSIKDAYRQAGFYVTKILKGEKPGDLPVMQSSKFEFIINLRTAKELEIEVSPILLARADEVIE